MYVDLIALNRAVNYQLGEEGRYLFQYIVAIYMEKGKIRLIIEKGN
jgi:hypothetical protein